MSPFGAATSWKGRNLQASWASGSASFRPIRRFTA
jgi:hypothetical protein